MKRVLYHAGLLALARLARQRARGLVLRYHALTDGEAAPLYAAPDICLPVGAFRLQMGFLARAYRVVPLDELVDAVRAGRPLPPRAVAVTFDDGYADNHRLAAPVLRALGLPATVYVATGPLDGHGPLWMAAVRALVVHASGTELVVPGIDPVPLATVGGREPAVRTLTQALVPLSGGERTARITAAATAAGVDVERLLVGAMLTWEQLRALAGEGWTIGAHTVSHPNVALVSPAEAESEIAASRDALAAATGAPVVHFAYPNTGGRHRYVDDEVARMLRRLGFRSGVTSRAGALRPDSDPFVLPRVGVSPRLAPVIDLAAALEWQRLAA